MKKMKGLSLRKDYFFEFLHALHDLRGETKPLTYSRLPTSDLRLPTLLPLPHLPVHTRDLTHVVKHRVILRRELHVLLGFLRLPMHFGV